MLAKPETVEGAALRPADGRVQAFPGKLVRYGDDCDLDDFGVLLDRLLDDLGADADPADLDVEVCAALEREEAVLVAVDDVARVVVDRLAAPFAGMCGEPIRVERLVQIAASLERRPHKELTGPGSVEERAALLGLDHHAHPGDGLA